MYNLPRFFFNDNLIIIASTHKKGVIFSAVYRKKNFGPTKNNNNKPTTLNCEYPYFQPCCSSDLARKKGRKKVAINSFQKKSIISIMKKRRKITAFVREEKENEKKIP